MLRLLWQELVFRRNAIIGWGLGLCFFPLVYISIYPSVADEMAGLADLEIYQAMGMSLGNFSDWVGSILIVFMPLIAAIYGIINGTGTLAGEEEDGRLEMVVTLPLPRWQIVAAKAIAFTISSVIMFVIVAVVSMLVFQSIESQVETEMVAGDMFTSVMMAWPIVFAVGMMSMFLAAFCASRRFASIIAAAVLVVGYFGSNLAASTTELEPFEPFFLFTYLDASGTAVIEGQAAGDMLVFFAIGLVSFALALFFFQRRNLTVGLWPWQRARVS
ncbi:ABC transporter permease subunit [Candidatus Leptofilum sp.]|uniref:ABC transporter permease subunit n=1 Tax=Candidatus Leptofilum sp. TaxID=3241576 RepID=UPI003B5C6FD6